MTKTASKSANKAALKRVRKPASKVDSKVLDAALKAQPPIVSNALPVQIADPCEERSEDDEGNSDQGDKGPSKMDLARACFKKMKGKERKDVIAVFIADIKLTKAGANTYFQILKSE